MSDEECPELISGKVPVTILTGFLGSGKTTLLHYVLSVDHHLKIAVIVNEFEFGKTIEKGLTMKSSEKEDDEWIELKNGCMCCTAQTQTVQALEKLMKQKGTFDLILVETSGLADRAGGIHVLARRGVVRVLYLSGIVTLVDSVNITKYLAEPDTEKEVTRQILMADKIILNKCDIADEAQQAKALEAVRGINPVAEVIQSDHSRVSDLRSILFIDTTKSATDLEHLHEHDHPTITACPLEFFEEGKFLAVRSRREIDLIGRDLLYRREETQLDVIRCKAAIWCYSEEEKTYTLYQFQSIGDLFDVLPMEGVSVPEGCSRALVLGRALDAEKIREIFLNYLKPTC
ncbi:COBW domain containing 2 [Angomonas deanei]|nr:COBW domain containing 2 [Angomonas deanei]|eukprot:EPY28846.1 COBW domain containing 2 [Angomonas deanei]